METKTVRVRGALRPVYRKARSTKLIMSVSESRRAVAASPQLTVVPAATTPGNTFLADLQAHGRRAGEGVPFAALYMSRGKKKLAALHAA